MQRARLTPGLSGVAGEYFVAAELSRRGFIASITLRNTRGIDILASNSQASKAVVIQVKTNQGSAREWVVSAKIETEDTANNLFYVFVSLNDFGAPRYHVVPRKTVIDYSSTHHREWLAVPSKNGNPHKDTTMRKFRDPDDSYLDRWDILGLD